jgi:hypothetical protein
MKIATLAEARKLALEAADRLAKDPDTKAIKVDFDIRPLPKGALILVTIGDLGDKHGRLPSVKDLQAFMDRIAEVKKDLDIEGDIAILAYPPVVKIQRLLDPEMGILSFHIGDADRHIHPSYRDLVAFGRMLKKCLKGHGPLTWGIWPAAVVVDDRKGHNFVGGRAE